MRLLTLISTLVILGWATHVLSHQSVHATSACSSPANIEHVYVDVQQYDIDHVKNPGLVRIKTYGEWWRKVFFLPKHTALRDYLKKEHGGHCIVKLKFNILSSEVNIFYTKSPEPTP